LTNLQAGNYDKLGSYLDLLERRKSSGLVKSDWIENYFRPYFRKLLYKITLGLL
jgi:hypothetical protein